jgi:hypothetical protein
MIGSAAHAFLAAALALPPTYVGTPGPAARGEDCRTRDFTELRRNPTEAELRCRFGARGPGRFGLLSYADVPVYQPATPMPGTHLVGVPGQARPLPWESFEEWEWRMLRTDFGPAVHTVHRGLDTLAPDVAARILRLEARLAEEGIRAVRRETWRSPGRQAFLFQQGRSRPGPLATATLTSWHAQVDAAGNPAARAVDYDMPASALPRFHELAWEAGLSSFGPDSHDVGHVFLPAVEGVPGAEIILLRTLPRVAEVTLATGLPTDRPLPLSGRLGVQEASFAFADRPFIPAPSLRIARLGGRQVALAPLLSRGTTGGAVEPGRPDEAAPPRRGRFRRPEAGPLAAATRVHIAEPE